MLPKNKDFSELEIEIIHMPTNTFKIDFYKNRIRNVFDGIEALKQAIYKILMTQRYKYSIYDWEYGIELEDLIGMPKGYVKVEIERRIKEALLQDDRIEDVYNFTFKDIKNEKSSMEIEFFIKSILGEFNMNWSVDI